MLNWENCVCQNVGSERIGNLNDYVSLYVVNDRSPIDQFYLEIQNIISLFPIEVWGTNYWVGSLASIAIVSSVENYFRQVFSKVLKICVDSQNLSSSNQISLGSVIWHPSNEIERGAFEHLSLASSEAIKKTANKFIGIDLKAKGLDTILTEFDKVCELRHGIVHSGREVAGKNGIKLMLDSTSSITKIEIDFDQFQEIMSVCNALVVATNKILFVEISRRWATTWRQTPSWNDSKKNLMFKKVWNTFYSLRDKENGTIPENLTLIKCRNQIAINFNI